VNGRENRAILAIVAFFVRVFPPMCRRRLVGMKARSVFEIPSP